MKRWSAGRAQSLVIASFVATMLFAPATAHAGTLAIVGTTLTYVDAPGDAANVNIELDSVTGEILVQNFPFTLDVGAGCANDPAWITYKARCQLGAVTRISLDLGDGADRDNVDPGVHVPLTIDGGSGPDLVGGADQSDTLDGGPGSDTVVANGGADVVNGGDGDDSLIMDREWGGPDTGHDVVSGGAGHDTARYLGLSAVSVSLDDVANDGQPGDHANIHTDVEDVIVDGPGAVIIGDGQPNLLTAGASDGAHISGGGGNDVLEFKSNSVLNGGPGDDLLRQWAGGQPFDAHGNDVHGGSDVDRLDFNDAAHGVTLTLDDVVNDGSGSPFDNSFSSDIEAVHGTSYADSLTGGPGDNQFDGGSGPDTFTGGGGVDTVTYASRWAPVEASLNGIADDGERAIGAPAQPEGDLIGAGIEVVVGGTAADVLTGDAAPNRLEGGGGDDVLDGDAGPDVLDGGAGIDAVDYSWRDTPVDATADGTPTSGGTEDGVPGARDTVVNDEVIIGGSADDVLRGPLTSGTELFGGPGADQLFAGSQADAPSYLDGGTGNDDIHGGPTSNTMIGDDGNDTISGGAAADVIFADAGADAVLGGGGDDFVEGGSGPDVVAGGSGVDEISYATATTPVHVTLGAGADDGTPGEGDDVAGDVEILTGGAADDQLVAGPGAQ